MLDQAPRINVQSIFEHLKRSYFEGKIGLNVKNVKFQLKYTEISIISTSLGCSTLQACLQTFEKYFYSIATNFQGLFFLSFFEKMLQK